MTNKKIFLISSCFFAFFSNFSAGAQTDIFSAAQQAELEKLFGKYVMEHPEVLKKSLEIFIAKEAALKEEKEKQQAREGIKAHEKELFHNQEVPFLGDGQAANTFVLFVDPYCGYCKKSLEDMKNLVAEKPHIKVSVRDLAILGAESETAVRALLVAHQHGKYHTFLAALKEAKHPLNRQELADVAQKMGVEKETFLRALESPEIEEKYKKNMALGAALKINGTPSLIVGDQIIQGYVPVDHLSSLVEKKKQEKSE